MTFLIDNIVLVAVALISGGLLLWPRLSRSGGATAVSPLEATQLINHRNAIVIDVRDEKDFANGSLAGARNIPVAQLADRAPEFARFKARPVVVVCGAGQQSAKALETFRTQGFTETFSLAGGIDAWRQASLPLVQAGRDNTRTAKEAPRRGKSDNRRQVRPAALPVAQPAIAAPVVFDAVAGPGDAETVGEPDAASPALPVKVV